MSKRRGRLVDKLAREGRFDPAWVVLLVDTRDQLYENWPCGEVTLDNGQARAILSLLDVVLGPTSRETFLRESRAGSIALDWWYRTEWLGQVKKAVELDMCADWCIKRTQMLAAKRIGRRHAERIASIMSRSARCGERLPNVEAFLADLREKQGKKLRGR